MHYLNKHELYLWLFSILCISIAFILFDRNNYFILFTSLLGATSLIFNAKGNPFGMLLMVIFSLLYGIISYSYHYYGEMMTYVGMTGPISLFSLITWLKHPFQGNKAEVEINTLSKKETYIMFLLSIVATFIFYFILDYFHTANMLLSTLSITTSFLGVYLTLKRSPYYAVAYACNDIILIGLWILATLSNISYISMVVCFIIFFINDIYGYINWQKIKQRQGGTTYVS